LLSLSAEVATTSEAIAPMSNIQAKRRLLNLILVRPHNVQPMHCSGTT
jgi:hypothetical protein